MRKENTERKNKTKQKSTCGNMHAEPDGVNHTQRATSGTKCEYTTNMPP